MQLPPIPQAEAPKGLESMVGSVYTFFFKSQDIPRHMLNQNYRSNTTLVEFSPHAEYKTELLSYSPDLKLNLFEPIPIERPDDWPEELFWTSEWSNLLNPDHPAVCYVYPDGRSSQWNQFEADDVASIVYLCHGRIASQLLNERDTNTGRIIIPESDSIYSENEFWNQAIGIVTPHRAQQGRIISRLLSIFTSNGIPPTLIRGAVDTVERYQGQQRDIIIASFSLGDPDAIFNEEEFLMSLNRFNVMASRARAKLIVFVSQEVVDHLSSDMDIL